MCQFSNTSTAPLPSHLTQAKNGIYYISGATSHPEKSSIWNGDIHCQYLSLFPKLRCMQVPRAQIFQWALILGYKIIFQITMQYYPSPFAALSSCQGLFPPLPASRRPGITPVLDGVPGSASWSVHTQHGIQDAGSGASCKNILWWNCSSPPTGLVHFHPQVVVPDRSLQISLEQKDLQFFLQWILR